MSNNLIIAFTGARGVGKTSVANELVQNGKADYVIESFATPIKDMLRAMGLTEHFINDPQGKQEPIPWLNGVSGRELMQTLGTSWGREMVADDVWLRAMNQRLIKYISTDQIILIDDLRFDNEAEFIVRQGGYIISLTRDGIEYTNEHSTETPISSDYLSLNDSIDAGDLTKAREVIETLID